MDEGGKVIMIRVFSDAENERIANVMERLFVKDDNLFPTDDGDIIEVELLDVLVKDEDE